MKTKVLKIDPKNFSSKALEKPAQILRKGGIVAFPTETVYGIGGSLQASFTLENLSTLKSRALGKHYTIHIADQSDIFDYITLIPPMATRVLQVYWPGPLTVIFPSPDGGTLGFRLPANEIARALIRQAGVSLVASSANPSEYSPACSAEDVVSYFGGQIPMVIDGGPTPLKEASTVVQFTERGWKMLRSGIITERMIQKLVEVKILFVCTGNICRSPMAETMLKAMLARRLEDSVGENVSVDTLESKGYIISSGGISAAPGNRASSYAQEVVKHYSGQLAHHEAQQITGEIMEQFDTIYVMTEKHHAFLTENYPFLADRVEVLDQQGIPDPYGGNLEEYRRCAAQIHENLEGLLDRICPSSVSELSN